MDYRTSGGRLPDFARPEDSALRALAALRPPARMTVSQAAAKYRRLDTAAYRGPWRNDVAPYMVEPMDALTSRRFTAAVFVGPARSSKTDSLIMNPILHAGICHPRNMLIVHINKDSARDFSLEKLGPMIQACPDLRSRQSQTRGSDNIFDKRFAGGCRLSVGWPVVGKLSARDLPFVAFTDYDRMDDDIDEEGSPFALGRKRTQTFGSLGMTVAESSPGRPILDETWSPKTPHEAPPTTGILALYNRGTRGRLYWHCPSCGEPFEPTFDRLRWPEKLPAGEAAAKVTMACPHHGCVLGSERRNELNAGAVWLHETDTGELVPLDDERIRGTDIVSWWMQGPAASFQPWQELVQRHLEGVEQYERTGDETAIKATVNLDQGRPYLPRSRGEAGGLSEEKLRARAVKGRAGVAPEQTRFVTVQVDVQRGRFVVQVDAWGEGLERWLVDRLELHQPPAHAPGWASKRALDPARYAEDWDVLLPLAERIVAVGDTGLGLRPVMVSIDSHGEPGVTDRAYAFWRTCRALGLGARFRLTRGVGDPKHKHKRAVLGYPEAAHAGRKQVARDVPIITISTDRVKDEIAAALTREDPGPGAYHLFESLDPSVFSELSAERRTDKGWERKAGGRRNEAFDLAVYGKALAIVMRAEKIDWLNPPDWARPVAQNAFAAKIEAGSPAAVEPVAPRPSRRRRVTSSYM